MKECLQGIQPSQLLPDEASSSVACRVRSAVLRVKSNVFNANVKVQLMAQVRHGDVDAAVVTIQVLQVRGIYIPKIVLFQYFSHLEVSDTW